jgi:hypothetical protein
MKRILLLITLIAFGLTACKKEAAEPTQEDMIKGLWAYYGYESKFYDELDEAPYERSGSYSDLIRLSFDGSTVSRTYPSIEPEAGPYSIYQSEGKYYIEVPYQGNRETYEIAKLTKDEMLWVQEKSDILYQGPDGIKRAKKAVFTIILRKK